MEKQGMFDRCLNMFETVSIVTCVFALFIKLIVNVIARTFFTSLYFAEEVSQFLTIFNFCGG